MKFLYTTDLHGNQDKYNALFELAQFAGIKLLHIGADFLPKEMKYCTCTRLVAEQHHFIKYFFLPWYQKCLENNIKVLFHFGNDDFYVLKKKIPLPLLDEKNERIGKFIFRAYGYVPDYKFGLKTACKLENRHWKCPDAYIHFPVDMTDFGFVPIFNIKKYFRDKSTLKEDLSRIKSGKNCIMSIHCPPKGLELDVCQDGHRVGSSSIYNWIKKEQPRLVLCGHIHESFKNTGIWQAYIKNSLVVQPSQGGKDCLHLVEISITQNKLETKLHLKQL